MSSEERIIERLISGSKSFACGGFIQSLNGFQQQEIYTDLYFDRLKRKLEHIRNTLHRYNNDWAQTAYYMLLRSMDVGRNRPCYEKLADTLPLKVIQRECISAENIESLLLGASGLIYLFADDQYIGLMKNRFYFALHKHQLNPMALAEWNLSRIPPSKHPVLRLSQVAKFISLDRLNIRFFTKCSSIRDIERLFRIEANNYWSDALMAKSSLFTPPQYIGYDKSHLLGINFIIPLQLAYAEYTGNETIRDIALNLLQDIKAENNHYIRSWASYGVRVKNALESQALIQLATEYCQKQRCDECPVGRRIIKESK